MQAFSPCCPRPDRHVAAPCSLLERLKDPRLTFDALSPEEQFFLFEAPYLPRFCGPFPAISEWRDPALNSHAFCFARLDRNPRVRHKRAAAHWRQEGSLYLSQAGFATSYFSDRTVAGADLRRWRLVEYLAPGSFADERQRPADAALTALLTSPSPSSSGDLTLLDESPPPLELDDALLLSSADPIEYSDLSTATVHNLLHERDTVKLLANFK